MTPDLVAELFKVGVPPAVIVLLMWMMRNPAPKEQNDPAKQLLAKLDEIARQNIENRHQNDAIENRIIDLQSEMKVLLDRRK